MKNSQNKAKVGIDDMAMYVPKLYLPIATLAEERDIEYAKLNKGLGLEKMAIPDYHEDAATMAANAVAQIIDKNRLSPKLIGRIYLGTESALDGAKPTATYMLEMLRKKYRALHGIDCLLNCDVVDLTFACVGGVDALHNSLDWVRGDEDRIGIVVTSDFAKYELASTGEYTQGAGAVAMLVKHNPRLLEVDDVWGVSTLGVHDFYKPKRTVTKKQIIEEALQLAGLSSMDADKILANLPDSLAVEGVLDDNDVDLVLHKDTPIFDGPYSNWCYQQRIKEAFEHFRLNLTKKETLAEETAITNEWARLIFHLPYSFHGKRIFSEIFYLEMKRAKTFAAFAEKHEMKAPTHQYFADPGDYDKAYTAFLKGISKTPEYRAYVSEKLEKAQRASSLVGNMYACSIFMALMSTLESDFADNSDITGHKYGFFGYGSGSKSKVFQATLAPQWREVVADFKIFDTLDNRTAIDYATYERLHRGQQQHSVLLPEEEFVINKIGTEGTKLGARYYQWMDEVEERVVG